MKKVLFSLCFAFILILLTGNVLADLCFQETANVSTACGGLDTGSYTPEGSPYQVWTNPELTYDEDYSTFGVSSNPSLSSAMIINYSKPVDAEGMIWTFQLGEFSPDYLTNVSINNTNYEDCWNAYPDVISIRFQSGNNGAIYCDVGGGSYTYMETLGSYKNRLYEEAVFWDIPVFNNNITNCQTINVEGNYNIVNNLTGSGGFCLMVNTDNVYIEGNNFKIVGDNAGAGLTLPIYDTGYTNITYKNVETWEEGTSAEGIDLYANMTLINSVFHGVTTFMDIDEISSVTFDYSTFDGLSGKLLIKEGQFIPDYHFRELFITQNSIVLSNYLNVNATITLYNLSFTNAEVLKDGLPCSPSICSNLVYVGGTATFDVTELGTYSIGEAPVITPQSSYANNPIYQVMDTSGAGLGLFLLYIAGALPILMLALALVGISVVIAFSVGQYLRKIHN